MSGKETEDFLTCVVCYDVYDDPRTLSCGHTFCLPCLDSFTKESEEASIARCVPCPYCRQMTKVPNSKEPRSKWAGQMKRSVILQELSNMAAIVEQGTEDANDAKGIFERKCKYHDKLLTSYCKDCHKVICSDCAVTLHKTCRGVVPARTALPSVTEELKATRDKLKTVSGVTMSKAEAIRGTKREVENSKDIVCAEIRAVCEQVVNTVRQREAFLVSDVAQKAEEEMEKLQLGVRLTEKSASIQEQQSDLIDRILSNGSENEIFDMQQICSKLLFIDEGPDMIRQFQMSWTKSKIDLIDNIICDVLKGTEVKYTNPEYRRSLCGSTSTGFLEIETEDEEEIPFLVDITTISHLDVYALVVTDNSNCCARSLSRGPNDVVQCKIEFPSSPWGIDKLVSNQVLVALPDSNQIVRLRVTPKLEPMSKIFTEKPYRSLAVVDPVTIAAGASRSDYACVDILDISGHILKSFSDEFPVMNPSYMTTFDQNSFIISDFGLGAITCVSLDGEVLFKFKRGLKGPSGVAVDRTGIVSVVDRENGNLVEFSQRDANWTRPKLTSLLDVSQHTPFGVCVDRYGYVYITQGGSVGDITCTLSGVHFNPD